MWIFGKERQSLRVKKIKAGRAVFINSDVQELEIRFITEDGDELDLQIPNRLGPELIKDLMLSFQAANPPIRMGNYKSNWNGMDN